MTRPSVRSCSSTRPTRSAGNGRGLEELFSLGVVRRGIAAAIRAGELAPVPVDLAARMINAMLTEAALVVRQGAAEDEEAAAIVSSLFDSLLRH